MRKAISRFQNIDALYRHVFETIPNLQNKWTHGPAAYKSLLLALDLRRGTGMNARLIDNASANAVFSVSTICRIVLTSLSNPLDVAKFAPTWKIVYRMTQLRLPYCQGQDSALVYAAVQHLEQTILDYHSLSDPTPPSSPQPLLEETAPETPATADTTTVVTVGHSLTSESADSYLYCVFVYDILRTHLDTNVYRLRVFSEPIYLQMKASRERLHELAP